MYYLEISYSFPFFKKFFSNALFKFLYIKGILHFFSFFINSIKKCPYYFFCYF